MQENIEVKGDSMNLPSLPENPYANLGPVSLLNWEKQMREEQLLVSLSESAALRASLSAIKLPKPAVPVEERTPRDEVYTLIEQFSLALKEKLILSEQKYGWNNGWMKMDWQDDLRRDLRLHVEKGDPLDVAAYCAFAWHHGWSTASMLDPVCYCGKLMNDHAESDEHTPVENPPLPKPIPEERTQDNAQNLRYATQIAEYLHKNCYPEVTQWKPISGDLFGVLMQIDNMCTGVQGKPIPEERTAEMEQLIPLESAAAFICGMCRDGFKLVKTPGGYFHDGLPHEGTEHGSWPWRCGAQALRDHIEGKGK